MSAAPAPTVGRIVHVRLDSESAPVPAIVTRVLQDDRVYLTVFINSITNPILRMEAGFGDAVGDWFWPPRV